MIVTAEFWIYNATYDPLLQIKRLSTALGACSRDKAKHEATLKKRAEDAEGAAAESGIALQRSLNHVKELQRRLSDADASLAAAGISGNAVGSAAVRACQVRVGSWHILLNLNDSTKYLADTVPVHNSNERSSSSIK